MEAADDAAGRRGLDRQPAVRACGSVALPPAAPGYGTTTDFERRMSMLAWLISSNVGIRVACMSFDDGFDFHDAQLTRQGDNHDPAVARALAAFQADLEARGVADRVITLVWSEFGRRVEDNDSGGGGTDHGAGGLAMVIGNGVNGRHRVRVPRHPRPGPRPVGQPEGADRLPPDLHVAARATGWAPTRPT